jgi:hypothetical protein
LKCRETREEILCTEKRNKKKENVKLKFKKKKGEEVLGINELVNVLAHVRNISTCVIAHYGHPLAINKEFLKVPADIVDANFGVIQFGGFLEIISSRRTATL